jgi:hypothetical protein
MCRIGLFGLVDVTFNFEAGGFVVTDAQINSANFNPRYTEDDWVRIVVEVVFMICLFAIIMQSGQVRTIGSTIGSTISSTISRPSALQSTIGRLSALRKQ